MNILLINHYAGAPTVGMEYRAYYLSREWQKFGHNVLIVTASYTHFHTKHLIIKNRFEKHTIEGVNYLIIKTPIYKGHSFKRILNILTFVWYLFKKHKELANEFKSDIVIASSTYLFDIFPSKRIAKINNAKLILEVHDLWPLSPVELGGFSRWHPFIIFMQLAENYAYRQVYKVISLLPNAIEYMVKHGLKPEKFIHIPNGIDIEEWNANKDLPENISTFIQKLKKQGRILIGYAGTHGLANALNSLIDAMKILENENVDLLLIGQGTEKENLISRTKQLKLQNVHFINTIQKSLMPTILNKLDILYIGLQKQPLFRFGISPNKLIDYMMAGKPIIQAIKAGNDMVSDAECGISIEPENSIAISEAIKYLLSLSQITLQEMGDKGKKYCIKNHDYRVLAEKYLDAFN